MSTVEAQHQTLRGAGFRKDIQGLRAIAVLLVIVFHTGFGLSGGFVGVDVFFVLSGFLIIGLLDREAALAGRIDIPAFFARRARRLLPAIAVVVTSTVAASAVVIELGAPLRSVLRTAAAAMLFVANAELYRGADYFSPAAERNPLLHTWSLSVEEQFYLVVPLLFTAAALLMGGRTKWIGRRAVWIALLALGSAGSFALNVLLVDWGVSPPGFEQPEMLAFYAPFTRAWQFGAGGLLALLTAPGTRIWWLRSNLLTPAGIILIFVAAEGLDASAAFPGFRALLPVLGTILILLPKPPGASTDRTGATASILCSRPLAAIGDLSYSLYLWHWPVIVLSRAVVGTTRTGTALAVLCSFLLAWVTYHRIEEPLRRNASLIGVRAVRLAAASVCIPLVVVAGVAVVNGLISSQLELGRGDRVWSHSDCLVSRESAFEWSAERCSRGREDLGSARVDVLLIGDSHANSLADGLLATTEQLGLSLGVWTVGGQPPHGSEARVAGYVELIRSTDPQVVIMAAKSSSYLSDGLIHRWHPNPDEVLSMGYADREELWAESLLAAVKEYRALGPRIVWVHTVPEFTVQGRESPETGPTLILRSRGFRTVSIAELTNQRGGVTTAEARALGDVRGVALVDPAVAMCAPECRNGDAGSFYYFDSNHLTPKGSRLLTGLLLEAVTVGE